jgi:hypothetical protein
VGGPRHAQATLPSGKTRHPLYRWLGGPQGQSGRVRKISPPPRYDPRAVQPVAGLYTDCVIPGFKLVSQKYFHRSHDTSLELSTEHKTCGVSAVLSVQVFSASLPKIDILLLSGFMFGLQLFLQPQFERHREHSLFLLLIICRQRFLQPQHVPHREHRTHYYKNQRYQSARIYKG